MAVSRFLPGRDRKPPYERQTGRRCNIEVIPFRETILYRLPEIARDKHQALEPRWAKGVWLGHARSTNAALVATSEGVIKVWGFRRLPGDRVKAIKGLPKDWKLDASEDPLQVELLDGCLPHNGEEREPLTGPRAGERRSMYLKRFDFETYWFTDGCPGCRDISIGRSGPSSAGLLTRELAEKEWKKPFKWLNLQGGKGTSGGEVTARLERLFRQPQQP